MQRLFVLLICCTFFKQALFAQKAIGSLYNQKIMIVGEENPISVLTSKVPVKEVSLEMANCEIVRIDDSHFRITPTKANLEGEKLVFRHKGKVIGEDVYSVRNAPPPPASVGGIIDAGEMNLGEFKAQNSIWCEYEGFDFDSGCRIAYFKFRIVRNGKVIVSRVYIGSPVFNEDYKATIKHIQPGDKVVFSDMKYRKRGNGEKLFRTENSFIFIKIK